MPKYFKIAKIFLLAITMVNLDDWSRITKIDAYNLSILIFYKKKTKIYQKILSSFY